MLVVAIGWLYLLPQFQGAGLTLTAAVDAPKWVGALVVGAVVVVNVSSGGMRSITFVQAFQYWLKLTALLVPAAILLVVWAGDGRPDPTGGGAGWSMPLGEGNQGLYTTYSIVLATFLGTMGLPHVVVRFYTNPDGGAARRTTLTVLALLGVFYLLPPIYAVLGRAYGAEADDTLVLELPRLMLDGLSGDLLTGVVTAGAFAAFLSTSSGLAIAVSGVLAQDVLGGRLPGVSAFRLAATFAVGVPLAAAVLAPDLSVARAVGLAFAVAASTFCPLLVLGIWWRGLTPAGAVAGLLTGGLGAGAGVAWTLYDGAPESWRDVLLGQPAAWSVPLAFAAMVGVSLAHPRGRARPRQPVHGPAAHPRGGPARPRMTLPGRRSSREIDRSPTARPRPARPRHAPGTGRSGALLLCGRITQLFLRGFVMTTDTPGAPQAHDQASRHDPVYDELHESADFVELRRRFRIFVFPATAAFLSWYLLYVVMSNWADDFMSKKVVGQHQRRPDLRPAAVRLDVLPRLALLQVHEPQRRPLARDVELRFNNESNGGAGR